MLVNTTPSLIKNRTALIADDDDVTRQLLRGILRSSGINVLGEAGDGARALALYQQLKPEVVCLDIDMPELNGLEVLKKIREITPAVIVLIITGFTTGDNVRDAISAGANGIIAKPFNTAKIVAQLERALARTGGSSPASNGATSAQ
jgi:two-component system chemotaxis response regulator CheY